MLPGVTVEARGPSGGPVLTAATDGAGAFTIGGLEAEKSFNATAGLVVDTGPFTPTADYFRVDIAPEPSDLPDDRPRRALRPPRARIDNLPRGSRCRRATWTASPSNRESGGGKPCIRGMRITVYDVLEYLASGMSADDIIDDFPDLTREDVQACLLFAADRERRLVSISAS